MPAFNIYFFVLRIHHILFVVKFGNQLNQVAKNVLDHAKIEPVLDLKTLFSVYCLKK